MIPPIDEHYQIRNIDHYTGKVILKQTSFSLLAYTSWLYHFEDLPNWEFRAGSSGLYAFLSLLVVIGQILTLFELGYQKTSDYKCKGQSRDISVLAGGVLVILMVCIQIKSEEKRIFTQRLILIRNSTAFTFYNSIYTLIYGSTKKKSIKLLLTSMFKCLRELGVVTFYYIALIEQLMIANKVSDYLITGVIIVIITQLDRTLFGFLSRPEVHLEESALYSQEDFYPGIANATFNHQDILRTAANLQQSHIPSRTNSIDHATVNILNSNIALTTPNRINNPIEQYLLKTDSGNLQTTITNSSRNSINGTNDSSEFMVLPTHENLAPPSSIMDIVTFHLSKKEYEAYLDFDYYIFRGNLCIVLIPFMYSKISGYHCSEGSILDTSEICLIGLFVYRLGVNMYIDVTMARRRLRACFSLSNYCLYSLLEHGVPMLAYVAFLYFVLIPCLK